MTTPLRLPGSVAEVDASPPGPSVGAFFDLDGTLVAGFTVAAVHGVDLRSSYFYADGDEDLALMHLVGNPRPVNPGPELTKVAERRGWPILRFRSRGGGGVLGRVRNLAAIGSLGPVAAGAVSLRVLTRYKRIGVNFLTS